MKWFTKGKLQEKVDLESLGKKNPFGGFFVLEYKKWLNDCNIKFYSHIKLAGINSPINGKNVIQKNNNERIGCCGINAKKLIDIIYNINATESKSDAKRLISGNAVKINNQNITDLNLFFDKPQEFDLAIGTKQFYKIILK